MRQWLQLQPEYAMLQKQLFFSNLNIAISANSHTARHFVCRKMVSVLIFPASSLYFCINTSAKMTAHRTSAEAVQYDGISAESPATLHAARADSQSVRHDPDYAEGLVCARRGDFKGAANAFLRSERSNPDSPAAQMREMLTDIYDFRNTDMINP